MSESIPLLILGLGNVLCGDDGLGAAAVAELRRRYACPDGVEIADGGTLGLSLLPLITSADRAILVDAIRAPAPAGSLVRLEGADVAPAVMERLSPHQIGVADLLHGARWLGRYPGTLVLLGLVPETIDLDLSRSPVVQAALPRLVEETAREARRLGYPLIARESNDAPADPGVRDVARVLGL
jgi:hydrogenase maturation protease